MQRHQIPLWLSVVAYVAGSVPVNEFNVLKTESRKIKASVIGGPAFIEESGNNDNERDATSSNDDDEPPRLGLVPGYPLCPSTCLAQWLGDGWCDSACAIPECGDDRGDCEGWCHPDCKDSWVGDGFCDLDCFNAECQFDNGDCDSVLAAYAEDGNASSSFVPFPRDEFDYSNCSCPVNLIHNGDCDAACNTLECNMDGGDCSHICAETCANVWLGDGECDEGCDLPACNHDKGDCTLCAPGCHSQMLGNGVCDKACLASPDCYKDAGDCWEVCWAVDKVDYLTEPFFYPHCRSEWRGDGHCDCFCNNAECDFDFGDCDGVDCSVELQLLSDLTERMKDELFSRHWKLNQNGEVKQRRLALGGRGATASS